MGPALVYFIIGIFIALLFLQLYFRIKVLKIYKRLVANEVEFNATHLFNKKKMEAEILPNHPEHAEDIKSFARHIQLSFQIALLFIFLIFTAGLIIRSMG